ncbi:MAG: site-2 protease family protein [Acidobacteriota bacterium]
MNKDRIINLEFEKGTEEKPVYYFEPPKSRIWINIVLFLFTILSTLFVGINFNIGFYYDEALLRDTRFLQEILLSPDIYFKGFLYTLTLMGILLAHEMGHYLTSRYYNIPASLPYFIPFPNLIGTFGAFIKIKAPVTRKKALFDIGVAGPFAGFVVAIPFLIYGLKISKPVLSISKPGAMILGEPIILKILTNIFLKDIPDNYHLYLHPIAFAAWFGLLATAFNLFPVGQLDGGHILYALIGKRVVLFSRIFMGLTVLMGIFFWQGWLFWAAILFIMGIRHPSMLDETPLDKNRIFLGIIAMIIFIISFTPSPIRLAP